MKSPRSRPTTALRKGESALLFVYGSLRRGGENHSFLAEARFLGEAWTEPGHRLLDLGRYPGMVVAGEEKVLGELFEVDAETLEGLDRFEGHPSHYQRRRLRLEVDCIAWAYFPVQVDPTAKPVPGGCWLTWRQRGDPSAPGLRPSGRDDNGSVEDVIPTEGPGRRSRAGP